jgi:peptidyl-tRNA hydrolase ICT1
VGDRLGLSVPAHADPSSRVNSKATLKIPLHALRPCVPRILLPGLRASRYLANRSDTLVIQSDESRKRSSNVESCFDKLRRLLEATARAAIPGQTTDEQKDRVKKLYVIALRSPPRSALMTTQAADGERGAAPDEETAQQQEKQPARKPRQGLTGIACNGYI